MSDGPEAPPSQPREDASKPSTHPREVNANGQREVREKRDPVEAVAECPAFRRQMLFTRPFNVYGDVIDATEQKNGKQEKDVPAIHFVLEVTDDGSKMCVGDEDGKKLGWINQEDNPGYEWNIRSVWKPARRVLDAGCVSVYVRPDRSGGSLEMPVNEATVFRYLRERRILRGTSGTRSGHLSVAMTSPARSENPSGFQK